jgi:hypothetical protein
MKSITLYIFVFLLGFARLCSAADSRSSHSGWKAVRSPDYGFMIQCPASLTAFSRKLQYKDTLLSYIPVCATSTVACFEYNGSEYEATTFEAAGISVNVLRHKRTEQDCNHIDTGSYPINTTTINGVHFRYGKVGGAALGHSEGGTAYRTFHDNVCFEIAIGITRWIRNPTTPERSRNSTRNVWRNNWMRSYIRSDLLAGLSMGQGGRFSTTTCAAGGSNSLRATTS